MTAIMVCLFSSDENKFCIARTPFQTGQTHPPTPIAVCASVDACVSVVQAGLGCVCVGGGGAAKAIKTAH